MSEKKNLKKSFPRKYSEAKKKKKPSDAPRNTVVHTHTHLPTYIAWRKTFIGFWVRDVICRLLTFLAISTYLQVFCHFNLCDFCDENGFPNVISAHRTRTPQNAITSPTEPKQRRPRFTITHRRPTCGGHTRRTDGNYLRNCIIWIARVFAKAEKIL